MEMSDIIKIELNQFLCLLIVFFHRLIRICFIGIVEFLYSDHVAELNRATPPCPDSCS